MEIEQFVIQSSSSLSSTFLELLGYTEKDQMIENTKTSLDQYLLSKTSDILHNFVKKSLKITTDFYVEKNLFMEKIIEKNKNRPIFDINQSFNLRSVSVQNGLEYEEKIINPQFKKIRKNEENG